MSGWGAQMGPLSIQGVWNLREQQKHINYLELMTVFHALTRWKNILSHQVISLQLENTTAVAYLLKEGVTQSISLGRLAANILLFAEKYNIILRPSYLPGRMNTEADALSRQQDQAEWMLHRNVAKKIFAHFGRPVVDLFASADTKQVHQYYTIDRHDPRGIGDGCHASTVGL